MDDLDGLRDIAQLQSALRGDFEIVASYGEEHPGAWAGAWWDNEPTVRIVAAFTGDAAPHDAALRPRLRYPDRLVVQSRQHSLSDLRRVREEIDRTLRQRQAQTGRPILASVGIGKAVISVGLRADQEHVASELASRYGSAVELRVGFFDFPERRRSRPRPPATPAPEPGEQALEGLEMSVEVDQRVLEAGDDGHGRLVLRNSSPERIGPLGTGQPLVGSLLNSSLEAVGGYSGAVAGTGRFIDLAPGASASLPVIFGTASTREDLGYVVPPGRYWLRVQMHLHHGRGAPLTNAPAAPLVQITIIPRDQEPRVIRLGVTEDEHADLDGPVVHVLLLCAAPPSRRSGCPHRGTYGRSLRLLALGIDLVDDLQAVLIVPLLTDLGESVLRCQLVGGHIVGTDGHPHRAHPGFASCALEQGLQCGPGVAASPVRRIDRITDLDHSRRIGRPVGNRPCRRPPGAVHPR